MKSSPATGSFSPEGITPDSVLTFQDWAGCDAMMEAPLAIAEKKPQRLEQRRREEMFSTTSDKLAAFVQLLEHLAQAGGVCVIGSRQQMERR